MKKNDYQSTVRYTYLLGTYNNTRFDKAEIFYRTDTTTRNTIYNRILALSKPIYDFVNKEYIIYASMGTTVESSNDEYDYNVLLYYDYISFGKTKNAGTGTEGGVAISGGDYSKLYDIKFERILFNDLPENVEFLKEELFANSNDIGSLPQSQAFESGRYRMLIDQKKPAFYDSIGIKWVDADGFLIHEKTNSEKELLDYMTKLSTTSDIGARFFGKYINVPFYWNGKEFLNSDGSIFLTNNGKSPKRVVHRFTDTAQITFGFENCIYNIVTELDLNGDTVNMKNGCSLEFNGGKITNGTIHLNDTKVPYGCNITDYITANITGTYKEGQVLYDYTLKKMKLWNGTTWVNMDGTALN